MTINQATQRVLPILLSALFSLAGILLFLQFDLPLPWLLGAIFPLLFASRIDGLKLAPVRSLVHPSRAVLGIAIGASFTPALLDSIDVYLISLLLMGPFLILVIVAGKYYYQRIVGFDNSTSVFCALPGGLLEMTLISEALGANVKQVVLTHTTRVLLIIYIVPFIIQSFTEYDLSGSFSFSDQAESLNPVELIILTAAAGGGWLLAQKLGLSGASIVGPMTVCAILYLSGLVSSKPPGELINLAQWVLGVRIGLSLSDVTLREFIQNFLYALGFFLLLIVASLLTALAVNLLTGIPLIASFLAFVPGGQAEMNVIAIIIGIHVPYIALHHVTRMFLVIAFAPAIERVLNARHS